MLVTVTIPETKVTLETKNGQLPDGTTVSISLPVKGLQVTKEPEKPVIVNPTPAPQNQVPPVAPPIESVVPPAPIQSGPIPRFDRSYSNPVFRKEDKRFDTLGTAVELGLSQADWTMVLDVRFVDFSVHQRVIGSATSSGAGSSLQVGVLEGGFLWVDTFMGGMTADQVELNRWYQVAISHYKEGAEKIFLDKKLLRYTSIPVFNSQAEIFVGRWLNEYSDFDLKRVRIYSLLSNEEIQKITD